MTTSIKCAVFTRIDDIARNVHRATQVSDVLLLLSTIASLRSEADHATAELVRTENDLEEAKETITQLTVENSRLSQHVAALEKERWISRRDEMDADLIEKDKLAHLLTKRDETITRIYRGEDEAGTVEHAFLTSDRLTAASNFGSLSDEVQDSIYALADALEHTLVLTMTDGDHALELYEDGDGWNEPRSEEWSCRCGVVLADWTQVDPECSGRTSPADVATLFAAHHAEELGS